MLPPASNSYFIQVAQAFFLDLCCIFLCLLLFSMIFVLICISFYH
uniref:Uncharacterized protein n=1 Tax=Arundo donax TaxID=35708 RepID=A0A0A9A6I6_ARUDO